MVVPAVFILNFVKVGPVKEAFQEIIICKHM